MVSSDMHLRVFSGLSYPYFAQPACADSTGAPASLRAASGNRTREIFLGKEALYH